MINGLADGGVLPCLVDVVIDSSKDERTFRLCEKLFDIYGEAFNWSRNPRSGLAAARNHGADICRSRYIRFHDDDDLIAATEIKKLASAHREQPRKIFLTHTNMDQRFNRPFVDFLTKSPGYVFNYRIVPSGGLTFDFFWGGRTSLPIEVFQSHQFDEEFVFGAEDIEFGYRITRDGWEIAYLKDISATQIRDFTVEQICLRAFNQGFSQGIILDKYSDGDLRNWAYEGLTEPGIDDSKGLLNQLSALKREGARLDAAGTEIKEIFGKEALVYANWIWDKMYKTSKQIGLEARQLGANRNTFIAEQLKVALA